MLEKAYRMAESAHMDQYRRSGEPYIVHPLEVAIILAKIHQDKETITAGILHDVIEDTHYTFDDVLREFGDDVAALVNGVTKLFNVERATYGVEQAMNFIKLFETAWEDVRVLLIKIADRLHNLRTMEHMPVESQKKKALETLEIYVPIAHRLGISVIRRELEDLAFKYNDPDEYNDLKAKMDNRLSEREDFIDTVITSIVVNMKSAGLKGTVDGRVKNIFNIYRIMKDENKTFEEIYDFFSIRVIMENPKDCYTVLYVLHKLYKPLDNRFKDYISIPKSNNYQSIHSTLSGPDGEPFEVQVRTDEMHRVSEYGITARWRYKSGDRGENEGLTDEAKLVRKQSWLQEINDLQHIVTGDVEDYMDSIKNDMDPYKGHVYCFTPKGLGKSLIKGATALDFAYSIHSAVGNMMVGALVNNRAVKIDHVISTGDRVEILTRNDSPGPTREWLNIAATSLARNKIIHWINSRDKAENTKRGEELLRNEAAARNVSYEDLIKPEYMNIVLTRYHHADWETLCATVGRGGIREAVIVNRLYDEYLKRENKQLIFELDNEKTRRDVALKNLPPNVRTRLSGCCEPMPGDEIVAFTRRGGSAAIHRADCANMLSLVDNGRKRLVEAEWLESGQSAVYPARVQVSVNGGFALMDEITRLIEIEGVPVTSKSAEMLGDHTQFGISVSVKGRDELMGMLKKIKSIGNVINAIRL
jgi:GTP pyrophosphokinase